MVVKENSRSNIGNITNDNHDHGYGSSITLKRNTRTMILFACSKTLLLAGGGSRPLSRVSPFSDS